jgi:hypothetical protein
MKLYPANPHYLEFRGKPTVIVGSGEHSGAVLNAAFDHRPYLGELARDGLNQLRCFSGTYRELPGDFSIADNTLAPQPDRFLCPWKRVGAKWDLATWDDDYWKRLKDFVQRTSDKQILVEYVLFCVWYNPELWQASPMHPENNVQGVGPTDKEQVYTVAGNALLPYQEAFVRKAADELRGCDNVYFEICNEPYIRDGILYEGDGTLYGDWHRHIARVIKRADPDRLVAVNYRNHAARIEDPDPDPNVAIANFHYARPEAVKENYRLNIALADDETGFAGQSAQPYRREAWLFLLAGGAMFSHLDFSFTVAHPDGTAPVAGTTTPGYGGRDLREQLGFLRRFLTEMEVWRLVPIQMGEVFAGEAGKGQAMGDPGRLYALYLAEDTPGAKRDLSLPPGEWSLRWLDPIRCRDIKTETVQHDGGPLALTTPEHGGEAALLITRRGK